MEPITATAIIAAIATGAASAAGKTAINDAYESLKALIKNKIGKNNELFKAITQLEKKPESEGRQMILQEEIKVANVDQDGEIYEKAVMLINQLKSLQSDEQSIRGDINIGGKAKIIASPIGTEGNVTYNRKG